MGFLDFIFGKRENRSDHPKQEPKERVTEVRKVTSRKVKAIEPCGFDFDDVLVYDCASVVTETGEVIAHQANIWPRGGNAEKLLRDVSDLVSMTRSAKDEDFPWDYALAKRLLDRCGNNLDKLDVESRSINYHMNLKVEGLTKTGKVKKFPVQGVVLFDSRRNFKKADGSTGIGDYTLNVRMSYFPNGSVGKARVIVWNKGLGLACNFAMADGELAISKKEIIGDFR